MSEIHPAFGIPVRIRVEELSEISDHSVARTIERMSELARADSRDPLVMGTASSLGAARLQPRQYAERVHHWVRNRVRFVTDRELAMPLGGQLDPHQVAEVIIRPRELVRMPEPQGDCDDFSMLVFALLLAGGVPASFATIAANPATPQDYSHVYVVAHLPEGDFPIDASHGSSAGWEAPNVLGKQRDWSVSGMNGLGCACNGEQDGLGYVDGLGFQASSSPNWLTALISSGTQIAQTVLQKPVYQSTPQGTTIYQGQVPTIAPPGTAAVAANILPGVDNTTLLLGAAALIIAISVMGRRK